MRPALVLQVAVPTALAAALSSVVASYLAHQAPAPRAGAALHVLLVTAALVLLPWLAVRPRLLDASRGELRANALVGVVVGYALVPATWEGRAYAAQLLTAPGTTTLLLDLALWLLVGAVAVLVASAPASAHEKASYARR